MLYQNEDNPPHGTHPTLGKCECDECLAYFTLADLAEVTFFAACDNCGASDVPDGEILCNRCKGVA